MKNYLLLCGGVGGAKLALGFKNSIDPKHLTIAVNTGDDFTHLDFKICPDLDTVMYTLAGESDVSKGWGRRDESWNMLSALDDMGGETWFQLGDKDLDLSTYDEIIICPSNPYVSINPMLQLGALSKHLQDFSQKVTVISPIVNSKSLKGPTAKMMLELGHQISVVTIGKFYQNYSQRIFIDTSDLKESSKLNELGYEVNNANLIMNNTKSKNALAHEIIQLLESR